MRHSYNWGTGIHMRVCKGISLGSKLQYNIVLCPLFSGPVAVWRRWTITESVGFLKPELQCIKDKCSERFPRFCQAHVGETLPPTWLSWWCRKHTKDVAPSSQVNSDGTLIFGCDFNLNLEFDKLLKEAHSL